jgi:hypothetical protein
MKKSTALADSYVRATDFASRLEGLQLPPEVWAVFAQCDTPRPPSEIARRSGLAEEIVASALRRLARRKLVQKHRLDWQAYLSAGAAVDAGASAPPTRHAPAVPAAPVAPAAPVVPVAPAVSFKTPVSLVLGNATAAISRRVEARQELRFRIEKTTPRPIAA